MADTVNSEIKRIKDAKASIKTSIEAKGVIVGDGTIDTYAAKIDEIQGGGASTPIDFSVLGYTDENVASIDIPMNRMNTIAEDIASSKACMDEHENISVQDDDRLVYISKGHKSLCHSWAWQGCQNLSYIPDDLDILYQSDIELNNIAGFFSGSNITKSFEFDWRKIGKYGNPYDGCHNLREVHIGPLFNVTNEMQEDPFYIPWYEKIEKVVIDDGKYAANCNNELSFYAANCNTLKHYENHISAPSFYGSFTMDSLDNLKTFIFDNFPGDSVSCFEYSKNLEVLELKNAKRVYEWYDKWAPNRTKLKRLSIEDAPDITSLPPECFTDREYPNLEYLGPIDCTNISTIPDDFFGYGYNNEHAVLTYFAGFKNAKCRIYLDTLKHLRKKSCQTIIDNLYDFKGSGSQEITFSINVQSNIEQEYIQKATDKGWTISFS